MTADRVAEAAPAKINLFLHVLGRRADGYHILDSLVVFADAADHLTAAPADRPILTLGGPFAASLVGDANNLVLRSARLLADAAGIAPAVRVELHKELPVASGIGGGSADAAATLRMLARLWRLPAGFDLGAIAARLGADVPVCLARRPARMTGVGDILTPAPRLPTCGIVLMNPGVPLPTADVFRARAGAYSGAAILPEGWDDAAAMARDLARLRNDLEPPAIGLCPVIADVLAVLRRTEGCLLARMSGSGATCFALFANAGQARAAAAGLARADGVSPLWWRWGGSLLAWHPCLDEPPS